MASASGSNTWQKPKQQLKENRTGKKGRGTGGRGQNSILEKGELTVQRLTAEVLGKAQKYNKIGPREFVQYSHDELTLDNIKLSCKSHFASICDDIPPDAICDVLVGDQGPSCHSLDQIPDMRLVHVRFVEPSSARARIGDTPPKKQQRLFVSPEAPAARSLSSLHKTKLSPSKAVPKSLSVLDMLKLGKEVKEKDTQPIELFSFDLNQMAWIRTPNTVQFAIEKEAFGEGAFRRAFKATSHAPGFSGRLWVVKRYVQTSLDIISSIKQTVEQHTKKVVQMHMLARNFSLQLEKKLKDEEALDLYGETLKYQKIYLGKEDDGSFVSVEEYVDGKFVKYINNSGQLCECGSHSVEQEKAESLAHFSYEQSKHELMVVDMQGSGCRLVDPEIASREQLSGDEYLFSAGNLGETTIKNFVEAHKCNTYCELLDLDKL